MGLNKETLDRITKAVVRYYKQIDNPPADSIQVMAVEKFVYHGEPEKKFQDWYSAEVSLRTDYINMSPKWHLVRIRFRLTPKGDLDRRSFGFLYRK